ncbi:MAG TPA: N-formylglutamate deformylase [Alphaproteobacteria bacterium]|nr:N-formylglutamate deformylase [Alphaproteobacteria bacterium]
MDLFTFTPGTTPLLVSIPHAGTEVPEPILDRLTPEARELPDTDWHVDRLYDFAGELGANVLKATHSRYVIDLNRPPDDTSLYPGQATTGLVPATFFDGRPLYRDGQEPNGGEIAERRETYWRPYHDFLAERLDRLKAEFGYALLYDAHSIRSRVPRLFDGRLPDFNIGTGGGRSAKPALTIRLALICQGAEGFETAVNGRFKGGHITRHYGDPDGGVNAVQMEIAQDAYMDENPPWTYQTVKAERVRQVLRQVLERTLEWGRKEYG